MGLRIGLIAFLAIGCHERIVLPDCPPDAPVAMGEHNGVHYRVQLQDALQCSRETGRPVLLLFDAYAQSNRACWDVLADAQVKALINDHLVLCVLMVDDRGTLSAEDTIGFPPISPERTPTTIGNRNLLLEWEYFGKSSQPLFALVDADFTTLVPPQGHVPAKQPEILVDWVKATLNKHP